MAVGLYLCLPWLYVAFILSLVIMIFSVVMGTSLYLIAGHLLGLTKAFLSAQKNKELEKTGNAGHNRTRSA